MKQNLLSVILTSLMITLAGPVGAQTDHGGRSNAPADPHFNLLPGYLQQADLPDSLLLLPASPADGSAALARDEEARTEAARQGGSARWQQAVRDAELNFPQPAENFSCAMGIAIDEKNTPRLYNLMRKMLTDVGLSTYGVKNKVQRTRPFVRHAEGTCTPGDEAILRTDGSYPWSCPVAWCSWRKAPRSPA
ncbi:hypothetical protein [Phreatobacter stygius]|uniref:Uncharacterized protein n=1 Tax=Phreatobacter stygius TaxID=1940610 RepID=A0A4D7BD23_9HYPH|nr:hypothetical protein [Phreatobacter stygius]QCI67276.1 hypothetical protein E8M01_25440 [Phreatobacter stygius]